MKIQLILFIILALLIWSTKFSWAADTSNGAFASASQTTQVTVTTNTQVLTYDITRVHWNIHPEGTTGIRCVPGLSNGNASSIIPSTSIGEEFIGGGYFDSTPWTPPQLSMHCTAESGSVIVDVWQDFKY
jgi:hypothetical protein